MITLKTEKIMKKIILPVCLLFCSPLFADIKLAAPPPPEVTEPDLNLTAEELQRIQNNSGIQKKQTRQLEEPALKESIGDQRDGIRVVQLGDDTVEEYRRGGQIYKIRVIPKVGKPYYIQPNNENGEAPVRGSNPTSNWKVLTF